MNFRGSYRLTAPSGIGSIRGTVEINDEVTVVLEIKIHTMIKAGEGCIGGSDEEVGGGIVGLKKKAEYRRAGGEEEKERFK